MDIHNYMRNTQHNAMCVSVAGVDFYFSFRIVVAFRANGRLIIRENEWGPTTDKHLNAIDNGDKAGRVSGEEFEKLLAGFELVIKGANDDE